MLKLKYLFPNIDLAEMVVQNWECDCTELFKYWNISSNAIYPFRNQGEVRFLRLAPVGEKEEQGILAELDFLRYLQEQGFAAIQPITSKNGRELEVAKTPWGEYYATVFKRVSGEPLGQIEVTDEIAFVWGKSLGQLHNLSKAYTPKDQKRKSWLEQLNWIEDFLGSFSGQQAALKEVGILKEYLATLPCTEENYGLVHYDFELDNVFYDEETKEITPIDFDDAMHHWYAMDLERSLNSIRDDIPTERVDAVWEQFLAGYRSEREVSDQMLALFPVFQRFANLYGYTRVLRSAAEQWEHEPEWLVGLRAKFAHLLQERSRMFGAPI